jgi:RNA polymerase sigma-70 factor (ECF subfamily)
MSLQTAWSVRSADRDHITSRLPRRGLLEKEVRQLLRSLAEGNTSAFWTLWDAYKPHLYYLCLSQMDGVREDAEDALSRCMLRALEKLPRVGTQVENVEGWLSRLTFNLCVDIHREHKREARRVENIEDVLPDASYALRSDADSPEDVCSSREAVDVVCEVVKDLPPRLREPFVLRFFQEMAYEDIAARLILSTDNVRKRIQQARDLLRRRLIAHRHAGAVVVSPRSVQSKVTDKLM